jgi:uncharacterized Rmd1/YagE family protein
MRGHAVISRPIETGSPVDTQRPPSNALSAHAILVSDRLTVDRSKYADVVSAAPLCYRKGNGFVVLFRYGAIVLIGLTPVEEKEAVSEFRAEGPPSTVVEEERMGLEIHPEREEGATAQGVFYIKDLTVAQALVIGDILAKSVALARYEREISFVFDTIEPAAADLAVGGNLPRTRKTLLQLIGAALLAQHRVSGRIAFAEKPDVLWEHPELERFYARLEDEYEIIERGTLLNGKVTVIGSAAQTFTDLIDTARSARLELLIVVLILAEIVIGAVTLLRP